MKPGEQEPVTEPRIRAISFDLAGTLIHTAEPVGKVYARYARAYGLDVTAEEIERGFDKALAHAPPLAFGDLPPRQLASQERRWWKLVVKTTIGAGLMKGFDEYFSDLFSHYSKPESWRVGPGVFDTLRRLHQLGLVTILISNFDSRAIGLLSGLALRPLLDHVVISSRCLFSKPAPGIFHQAVEDVGLAPGEVLHVGDSVANDFIAARKAGLRAVYLKGRRAAGIGSPSPSIRSLPELLSLVT